MISTFNNGTQYARDKILALILGCQNKKGHNNPDDPTYKAYQEVYDLIVKHCGDMFTQFEG